MNTLRLLWLPVLLAALLVVGCQQGSNGSKDKIYDVKGKVLAVDAGKKTVKLDHEDIPGLMKAMEMDFTVADAKLLEGLKVDDQVHGKLTVKSGNQYVLTQLQKD